MVLGSMAFTCPGGFQSHKLPPFSFYESEAYLHVLFFMFSYDWIHNIGVYISQCLILVYYLTTIMLPNTIPFMAGNQKWYCFQSASAQYSMVQLVLLLLLSLLLNDLASCCSYQLLMWLYVSHLYYTMEFFRISLQPSKLNDHI